MTDASLRTLGRSGQRRYAGRLFEEFLPELRGRQGIEVYREMSQNDSVIGAVLFAVEMLVRQVRFEVEPASNDRRDRAAADFLRECLDDMDETWQDNLSEMLSFLTYGWSWHEILYKRREAGSSRYPDGRIGWSGFALRPQDTLSYWKYDGERLLGMVQSAPPDWRERFIPQEKSLHLRTKAVKGSPEGISILRTCYRDYYFKKNLQETEGIGAERGSVGLPVLTLPEGLNIWDGTPEGRALQVTAEHIVQGIRRDNLDGVVLPFGWKLELLQSPQHTDLGAIIERYDRRIAMSVLADFILLGQQKNGSYALSSDKTRLFALALSTYLDIICQALNTQAVPRLFDLNRSAFGQLRRLPAIVHGDIEKPDLSEMSAFIDRMAGRGMITADEQTEDYLRRLAELPARKEGRHDVQD